MTTLALLIVGVMIFVLGVKVGDATSSRVICHRERRQTCWAEWRQACERDENQKCEHNQPGSE